MTLPLLLFLSLTLPLSSAHAGSSWKSEPDWVRDDRDASAEHDDTPTTKRSTSREKRRSVSPFSPGSHNISVDIGQVFLLGEMASNYSNSIGARLHYTYGVSEMFGFDASGGYSNHSNGQFSLASAQAGLRVNLSWYDRVVPFAVAGMGFFRPSFDIPTETGIENVAPIAFGLHFGPGIHLELTQRLFFGASLQFQTLFSSRHLLSNNRAIEVGGSFSSFFLHAGFTL